MTDRTSQMRGWLRSGGAAVLFAYVVCHLGNHILLLISVPFAIAAHHYLIDPWRGAPGTVLLVAGALAHYGNALWSVYVRRSFRLSRWGWWQLGLGVAIPLLLAIHLSDTRLSETITGLTADYRGVLLRLWVLSPWKGVLQVAMLSVVWAHAMVGFHFWWRVKPWYGRWRPLLAAFAILWPALALAGYVAGGETVLRTAQDRMYLLAEMARTDANPQSTARVYRLAGMVAGGHLALIGLALGARELRRRIARRRRPANLTHANGRVVPIQAGATILETLFEHGIRHASVCGGRARCTTCRVRVLAGAEALPRPSALEAAALARIGAPGDLRLACQTRPTADVAIVPLLPPSASPADGRGQAGFAGHERFVTVMFVDLRGSTALGETRLPFDVMFLLDVFFGEMATALRASGGHFSQFTGDGLMALYGLDGGDPAAGARAALGCAADMLARLDRVNHRLLPDLAQPLRIGIGIHQGEAIVGPLGPPGSRIITAIGDTVNTTARLEGLSKQHDGAIIVSRRAAEAAGIDLAAHEPRVAALAGRSEPVAYFAFKEVPRSA